MPTSPSFHLLVNGYSAILCINVILKCNIEVTEANFKTYTGIIKN